MQSFSVTEAIKTWEEEELSNEQLAKKFHEHSFGDR